METTVLTVNPTPVINIDTNDLILRLNRGDKILIEIDGEIIGEFKPVEKRNKKRQGGWMKGQIPITDDFDKPLLEFKG